MPTKTKFDLKMGMATREAFGKTLAKLGAENPAIVVCDADLSKSTYTHFFAKDFPDRLDKPVDVPYGPYADGFSEQQHKYGPFAPIREALARLRGR